MKVTVTFRDTAVVVPCKSGWTVRDLIDQATRRYRRVAEQHGEREVKTHHLEYAEGGILDKDDLLSDLVEDRDKLVAVFDEVQRGRTDSPRESISNSSSSATPSPEPSQYFPHLQYKEPIRGEIEVNEATLKGNTPLLVRSSSDSCLAPPLQTLATPPSDDHSNGSPEPEINHVLSGAVDRLRTGDPPAKMSHVNFRTLTRAVEFPGDWGPLGIHVVPYCSSLSGRTLGLHIKGIEQNSRARKENIFQEDECIVQINGTQLQDKTFAQAQEVFRQAMSSSSVRLEVLPLANKPRYEKSLIGQLFTGESKDSSAKSPMVVRAKTDSKPEPKLNAKQEVKRPDSREKTPEPTAAELQSRQGSLERVSPAPAPAGRAASSSPTSRTHSQSPMARKSPVLPGLANLTNRKGGKKIKIDLKKGAEGLGFTVVTRDSSVHGPGPILVKNILSRGAAVKDGRLQPGDRILEVNGVDMTGRSQEELVAMLRSTKQGESVSVVVARQEDIFLPRELKGEDAGSLLLEDGREQLMYEIPLNESGSAGLGVSLKGNKSRETGEDLGIFIKSIIHGGAAHKDGRLSINDQLIAVNGESLLGRSNHAAMETLRSSMSSEGNSRGTIQLVVLRAPRQVQQMGSTNPAPITATNGPTANQPNTKTGSSNQEPWGHTAHQGSSGPFRPQNMEPTLNGGRHSPVTNNSYAYGNFGNAAYPAASSDGSYGHYSNDDDEGEEGQEQGFPPPPSPSAVEEMNRDLPQTPPRYRDFQRPSRNAAAFYEDNEWDNRPRNRASKSMDLVADESNVGSLVGQRDEPSSGGSLGPTLGLWKSSSLESLQTAMSEAQQSRIQAQVPFHRPRPHVVRGRGCNQSFRIAIDKSYEGPSEDDDDLSEQSSDHETPVSLDTEDGKKKKKTKGKKKEKKNKGKKKGDDSGDELEKKPKKKGFGLLRFGRKKEDKSKDAAKASKSKLEALSEEELDRIPDNRDGYDPRYTSGEITPDPASLPDMEDDDSDPNYARINNFRQPPSPQTFISRTPSPAKTIGGPNQPQPTAEELDGLYAKVNKSRPPPALQNQHQTDSDQRHQGLRREYQQGRAAPGYEELDAARRRVLEYDPHRLAPRDSQPVHRYEEVDRQYPTHSRRDPYDYPTHSRPAPREPVPYPGHYHDPNVSSHPSRVPLPTAGAQHNRAPNNPRSYPSSPRGGQQHRGPLRQDVPPSPTAGRRGGRPYHEAAGGRGDPRERYTSPERYDYRDGRQPDPRRKNPMINAV